MHAVADAAVPVGFTAAVSFGPGQAYALGPVYLANYDPATKQLVVASKPEAS